MRDTQSPVMTTIGASENADDVLGQFYYAFGQGAGNIRVDRSAIAALRRRYFTNIKNSPAPWNDMAGSVLSLIAQVGRLAGLLATQAGRTAITEADFMQARASVESTVHPRANDTGRLVAGSICALLPEDEQETNDDDQPLESPAFPDLTDMTERRARAN